jgi:sulfite exporter TauE/SafE
MHELTLATAFAAGLLGSTHCVAMCGGIATALGTAQAGRARRSLTLLHQLGRIASYGGAGALAGALGAATGQALAVPGWSDLLRLATAVVVVLIGLDIALGSGARLRWLRAPERAGARLWRRIAPLARAVQPSHPAARALTLGLLWGWLPCGLVYSVLVAATVTGDAASGATTMISFGLGTAPAMLGLSYAGARLPTRDGALARVIGAVIVACGLWTAALPIAALTGTHDHTHAHHIAAD